MTSPTDLLEQNRAWATHVEEEQPELFDELVDGQAPDYLWISCSDSRVPASQVVDCNPGDLFVHRNIANRVDHSDLNGLSVLQFAVEVLQVSHVVVCGHYQCGGVRAALGHTDNGLLDNWLRPIKRLCHQRQSELEAIEDEDARWNRLCELNVVDQVHNLAASTVVQKGWQRGQDLAIHGWVYDLADGQIHDLKVDVSSRDEVPRIYQIDPSADVAAQE